MNDNNSPKTESSAEKGLKDSISGTIAGAVCLFVAHPFDTIKVRLQTNPTLKEGALKTLSRTVKNEGVLALYKGVTSPLAGMMFETSVLMTSYGQIKLLISHMKKSSDSNLKFSDYAISGAGAGVLVSVVLTPVELIKCRLQIQRGSTSLKYKSSFDCLMSIFKEEGLKGLFRGFSATAAREVPGNAAFFSVYETCKKKLTPADRNAEISLSGLIFSGGIAGLAYWTAFYPADVAKSQIQTTSEPLPLFKCLRKIFVQEGFRGLFRGYLTTIFRAFPANAALFTTYEIVYKLLSNITNTKPVK